ncbi:MAG: Cj0069 family protein [Acetobacteraceae bacterium]|jgi:hypothetical protein
MPTLTSASVALLWRGDIEARRNATPVNNRWRLVFAALKEAGIHAEPAVYCEEAASDVRQQLLNADGVLVWVDPLSDGRTRLELDAMLREVASSGVWVSAHPDVTQKMGVKEVLYTTRHLGWGTDTQLYRTYDSFHAEFPRRLHAGGPRVVKQNRGNGGQGVWKVQVMPGGSVSVLEARRGSEPRTVALDAFMSDCAAYFEQGGCIIDQPFQQSLTSGMIRCYMGTDRAVGFGHQYITALLSSAEPGPRIMHPASAPEFRALRSRMETEWMPQLTRELGIERDALPIIWDADFLYGPGEDDFVLCEINVSSVMPIPDQAPREIARLTRDRLLSSTRA